MLPEANMGLVEGSMILTLMGPRAVETLRTGDRIVTRSGAMVLRGVEARVMRHARLVRVTASALAPERPEEDVTLAADQPILVRDWRATALAGAPQAMIPADRLADGEYIRAEARRDTRIFALHFDRPAVIYAQGLELGCEAVAVAVPA
jgi:hypothetical protein